MAQKDISEKMLLDYNDVFADIVNVVLFHGERILNEENLQSTNQKSQYKADGKIHEMERDVSKFWKDGHVRIALVGLENQTAVDRDMPLRIIGYDGAAYREQLLNGRKKRYPVVTIVLYFGKKPWEKYTKLSECIEIPEELKPYVNDYKINVVEVAYLTPEQVNSFQSDFKIVADYFVQSRTKKEYTPSEETMKHVDEILKLMTVLTGNTLFEESQTKITDLKNEGGISMRNVFEEYAQKEKMLGIEQGKEELILSMLQDGLPKEQVCRIAKITMEQLNAIEEKLLQTV
jgi:hypothetical protein